MNKAAERVLARLAHSQETLMKSEDVDDREYVEIMDGILKAIDYIRWTNDN